jgi:hypothetical protein
MDKLLPLENTLPLDKLKGNIPAPTLQGDQLHEVIYVCYISPSAHIVCTAVNAVHTMHIHT